jgi:hypothetical protein
MKTMIAAVAVVVMMFIGTAAAETTRDSAGRIISLDTPDGAFQFRYDSPDTNVFSAVMLPGDEEWTLLPGSTIEETWKGVGRAVEKQRSARGIIRAPAFIRIDSSPVHRAEQGGGGAADYANAIVQCSIGSCEGLNYQNTQYAAEWSNTVSQINSFAALHDAQDQQACMSRCGEAYGGASLMCSVLGMTGNVAAPILCTGGAYAAYSSCQSRC